MTNDTAHTYAYDAEGHVVSISTNGTTTLKESYNALGWRVEAINCCGTVDYVHDAAGNMVGGSANAGPGTSEQYIFFRGGLLAQYWNGQGLWFAHLNGLGSTQQFTDYTGGNTRATMFYPFGQPGPSGSGSGSYLEALWSGFEDGDFWATSEWQTDTRRYTPGLGRWYTPDPIGKAAARLDFPQTWNMYTYVQNNPTTLTDPSGEFNLLTSLLEAVTPFVSEALDAGSYLVKDVTTWRKPKPTQASAPTNPDGTPKAPPNPPPPGKDGKPNEWVRIPGSANRPDKWKPRDPVPSPEGSQPGASWDEERGHWDVDDGSGNRTRYVPDGTKVDHNNNPIPMSTLGKVVGFGVAAGVVQTVIETAPEWLPLLLTP